MDSIKAVLDTDDLNIIFEAICESDNVNVADGEIGDLFMLLVRLGKDVTIETNDTFNSQLRGIVEGASEIINELEDDDFDFDDEQKCDPFIINPV